MDYDPYWRSSTHADAPVSARRDRSPNVVGAERWLSIVGGGTLATWGLRRGGALGLAAGAVGAGLVARGVTGHGPVKRALGPNALERDIAGRYGWKTAAAVARAVTINRSKAEVYAFWRHFPNLTGFMENIERIDAIDDTRSHWVVKAPGGQMVEWDSLVTEDVRDERIAWESTADSQLRNAGWVEFRDAPAGRGTELHAMIAYEPPAGQLGRVVAKLFRREPAIQVRHDLCRLKQLLETGEIATNAPQDRING